MRNNDMMPDGELQLNNEENMPEIPEAFAKEYIKRMKANTPDIWDRIEAGIGEKENAKKTVTKSEAPIVSFEAKKKKSVGKHFMRYGWAYGLAAVACICGIVLIPKFLGGDFTNRDYKTASATSERDDSQKHETNERGVDETVMEAAGEIGSVDDISEAATGSSEQSVTMGSQVSDQSNQNSVETVDSTRYDETSGSFVMESYYIRVEGSYVNDDGYTIVYGVCSGEDVEFYEVTSLDEEKYPKIVINEFNEFSLYKCMELIDTKCVEGRGVTLSVIRDILNDRCYIIGLL